MASKVKIISIKELESMHTGSLMSRRNALLACEDSFENSDKAGYENKPDPVVTGYIEYKDNPHWQTAYQQTKKVLACRENLPSGDERKQQRIDKAKHNRSNRR